MGRHREFDAEVALEAPWWCSGKTVTKAPPLMT